MLDDLDSYLSTFQSKVDSVSSDIKGLQQRSLQLTTLAANRNKTAEILGPVLDDLVVPSETISLICERDINRTWVEGLRDLDIRLARMDAMPNDHHIRAYDEISSVLHKLKNKAIARIRDYIVLQIKALRQQQSIFTVQSDSLVPYHALFAFLVKHAESLAVDVSAAYCHTMRWYYGQSFERLYKILETGVKTVETVPLLGQDDTAGGGVGGLAFLGVGGGGGGARVGPSGTDLLNVGTRHDILTKSQHSWKAFVAIARRQQQSTAFYAERPYLMYNTALMDTACLEYQFLFDFFGKASLNELQPSFLFSKIFDRAIATGTKLTHTLSDHTLDLYSVLISIRLTHSLALELQRRTVPILDAYLNEQNMLLWPRFQSIIDKHSERLRQSHYPSKTIANEQIPLRTTQKFSELILGILLLSAESGLDEPVGHSIERLRNDFEAFLTRTSSLIKDNVKRERFLANNYALVSTIISGIAGDLAAREQQHFGTLLEIMGTG